MQKKGNPWFLVFCFLILSLLSLKRGESKGNPKVTQAQVNKAIDKGLTYLLKSQLPDGSFFGHNKYPAGATALVMYTLIKCGIPKNHQSLRRAEAYILSKKEEKTYSYGCILLALEAYDKKAHAKRIFEMAKKLVSWQKPNGLWGYPGGSVDYSNSQYALLGLWAATKAGFKIPYRTLVTAANGFTRTQAEYGGFHYRPRDKNYGISGSMTAAGVGSMGLMLKLMKTGVDKPKKISKKRLGELHGNVSRGLLWFGKNFESSRNPYIKESGKKFMGRVYYYLYGVERMGAFTGAVMVGKHDWYWEGAEFLVKDQKKGGYWRRYPGDVIDTCFALLFLRRATRPVTEYTPRKISSNSKKYDFSITLKEGDPAAMWVTNWPERLADYYGWEDGKLRIAWLRWIANKKTIVKIEGDIKKPCRSGDTSFAHKHTFTKNGIYTIWAEAELVDEIERHVKVTSNRVKITIDNILMPEFKTWMDDVNRNLFNRPKRKIEYSVKASTTRYTYVPENVIDHYEGTSWVCKQDDNQPWIEINISKPVKATHLVLTPAIWNLLDKKAYNIPKIVIIRTAKKRFSMELPNKICKSVLSFGKKISIKRIYIIIPQWHLGKRYKGSGGFAEIELQNRAK